MMERLTQHFPLLRVQSHQGVLQSLYQMETKALKKQFYVETREETTGSVFPVIRGVDVCIEEGDFIGIMGRSGCGKTTFLKILGLLEKPSSGTVLWQGQDIKELWKDEIADIHRRKIGFVFQDFNLLNSLNIRDNIMVPMILDKADPGVMKEKANDLADRFGITQLLGKYPYELSGGEQQRAAICRALINNPEIIMADEPTGNLDSVSGQIVIEALTHINRDLGKTVIMVTHDPYMGSFCESVLFMKDGTISKACKRTGTREEFHRQLQQLS